MQMSFIVGLVLLTQSLSDPVRRAEMAERGLRERSAVQQPAGNASAEKRRFEEKFNQLVRAVAEFSREYNNARGNV